MTTAPQTSLDKIVGRLAERKPGRAEAEVQADVRQLLLDGDLNLGDGDLDVQLEAQVGDGRRIDVEVGFTAIEIKKDIRGKTALQKAEQQLKGYVRSRTEAMSGQRYVGILTDGVDWRVYEFHPSADLLTQVHRFQLTKRTAPAELLTWLEGVLATAQGIKPTPHMIEAKLGAGSIAHSLDFSSLSGLYERFKLEPTVQLKRELWSEVLKSALGAQFEDSDALFIEHTLLVNTASTIAHLVLDMDVAAMPPATLVRGDLFAKAGIEGVVESDFFAWLLEVDGGPEFVRTAARRLSRFDWAGVEHDVLKVLYESVIAPDTRKKQGEYYTPDWLAEAVVDQAVPTPLEKRALDPSCGSGTFLFHLVRRYLDAADAQGVPLAQALDGLTDHVAGIDLHPVAVALARVTYLLAIGKERLRSPERGRIRVPVYLGDSLQWDQESDLLSHGHLLIRTGAGSTMFERELRFPEHLLKDSARFDGIVNDLAERASAPSRQPGTRPSLTGLFNKHAISAKDDQDALAENFRILCELVDEGRNHIWAYYVRNRARPMWLARPDNRVDVLVGNPPWLSFRHMPHGMQQRFKEMSRSMNLWRGDEDATHQDLSGLFIARAVQQYLTEGGVFAFVVPNSVLDRPYWAGFRAGNYPDPSEPARVAFSGSWDLRRLRPHFFPRGSAVVFGSRLKSEIGNAAQDNDAVALPSLTERWTGKIPATAHEWADVTKWITREAAELRYAGEGLTNSPYHSRFWNGATIFPRVLFFVQEQQAGPLGLGSGRVSVRSERSAVEKAPWRDLPDLDGVVEAQFVRPVLLGENVLPYRLLPPRKAVLPIEGTNTIMHGEHDHIDQYPGLAEWWRAAEGLWQQHRTSARLTLLERLDFHRGLRVQLPATPLRVVYGKAGMHVSAALVEDANAVIENKLYWGTVASRQEAMYLLAIMNSPALTEAVRPLMSYGKDERDIDKAVWELPIPDFDPQNTVHGRLAEIGQAQEELIRTTVLDESKSFVRLRQAVRQVLSTEPHAEELDQMVRELVD
ncbi:N-6 DNA methylase [Streptomyces sp. NPDC050095]|uniref:N-6 DNA methylase n=1 Tax=unclassified Streptomyces TaxID=2593676 RepID=UPI00343B80E0